MKFNGTFEIGDKVVTTFGEVGHIVDICKCEYCVERGFFEPIWEEDEYGDRHYITCYMADSGFDDFVQIGKYRFDHVLNTDLAMRTIAHHEKMLARWKKQLTVIDEIEKERG